MESRQSRRFAGVTGHFVGFKIERYISVGFGEMGPHKDAVHVGFGNDGEATELEVKSSDSEPLRRG